MNKTSSRLVIFGVDGLEWAVINLLGPRKLPNLHYLIENGSSGSLRSNEGYHSPVLWTSIATGKKPEKHGIWEFTAYDKKLEKTVPVSTLNRKTKAFWNILSEVNIPVGIYNWMVTSPAEKVNGFMVSNRSFYENRWRDVYPAEMAKKLPVIKMSEISGSDSSGYLEILAENIYKRDKAVIEYLLSNCKNPELFAFFNFSATIVQHKFWKYLFPDKFDRNLWDINTEGISAYKNIIPAMYIKIDALLGKIIERLNFKKDVLMVISDHGFKANKDYYIHLNLNRALQGCGIEEKSIDILPRGGNRVYIKLHKKRKETESKIKRFAENTRYDNGMAVYNVLDENDGKLTGLDKEFLRDYDVILECPPVNMKTEYILVNDRKISVSDMEYVNILDVSGVLRYEGGVILAAGRNIRKNFKISGASIFDITPTLLYIKGLPVAKDMDGRVMKSLFRERKPSRYVDTYDKGRRKREEVKQEAFEKKTREMLERLGYL